MLTKTTEKIVSFLVLIAGPAVGLFITPSVSTDPVNQPKMLILTSIVCAALGVLFFDLRSTLSALNNKFGLLCAAFVSQLFLVLLIASAPKDQQFFGVFGRNTGVLTYLGLVLICICAYLIASPKNLERIVLALIATGVISAAYSGMQTFGLDPVKWKNPYNPITAFLGNPNFQSSFLAISAIAAFGLSLRNKAGLLVRLTSIAYILCAFFLILRSNSQQGILVLGAGIFIVISLFLIGTPRFAKQVFLYPYFFASSLISIVVIMGTLNHGPLANMIYKLSVRQRGFYWHAAVEMMKSHPIFGVGMDSYGSWYFETRSKNAAFHSPQVGSSAAHNVFLDLGAFGGFPLLFIYLTLVILTFWSVLKVVRRSANFNWSFAALVGAWVGYLAQSIISINQIGLAVWGWLLMGLIIGFSRYQEISQIENTRTIKQRKSDQKAVKQILSGIGGASLGIILVMPLFNADAAFREAITNRNGEDLLSAAQARPIVTYRLIQAAQVFANSNIPDQANMLLEFAIKHDPRSYDAWELKKMLTDKSTLEYQNIIGQLRKLNPNLPLIE